MAPSVTETLVIQNEQPTTSISDKQRNGVMKKVKYLYNVYV